MREANKEELLLLEEAVSARENSYSPYSDFMVGAALVTKSGKVFKGCNVENAGYSPTNCAERTAFFKAISEGEKGFTKIAVVGAKRGEDPYSLCTPCGVCRQVMMEFCHPDSFEIIMADGKGKGISMTLSELLPLGFGPNNL